MILRRLASITLLLSALCVAPAAAQSISPEAREARLTAARSFSEHYVKRVGLFLDQSVEWVPGGTVFLGDSITEGFPLAEAFPGGNVINQGIGGDKIAGVRARLDLVALAKPSAVYLMIGTNDVAWRETATSTTLCQQYGLLLDELKQTLPDATVTVQSVLPTGLNYRGSLPRIQELNGCIQSLCAERSIAYVDIFGALAEESQLIHPEYTTDGIHLTLAGYWRWLRVIRTPDELLASAKGLASRWQRVSGRVRRADKVDPAIDAASGGNRGSNELVVYTPAYGAPKTGTNAWGTEAIVRNGRVEKSSPSNSEIPADGFVASGHGDGAQWVAMNLRPGVPVLLEDGQLFLTAPRTTDPAETLDYLEGVLIGRMAATEPAAEVGSQFLEVQRLRSASPTAAELAKLWETIEPQTSPSARQIRLKEHESRIHEIIENRREEKKAE